MSRAVRRSGILLRVLRDAFAAWFLRPRRAFAMASVVLLVGLSLGIAQGASQATDLAKARYLDSVSPPALRQ